MAVSAARRYKGDAVGRLMGNFVSQLKQRRVYRVAIGYAIVAWLMVQIAATVLPAFHAPEFILPVLIVLLGVGFPVALVLAWAFDITPTGIEKTSEGTGAVAAKNVRYTWALAGIGLLIAVIGVGAYWWWHSPGTRRSMAATDVAAQKDALPPALPAIPKKSIAVLPFDSLSDDKNNAFFAEGVQDEILTRLAKVADLKVIARTSTKKFQSAPENLPDIAKQLGVMNILEGSVQKSNDQVRVNVQLINALTNAHLWAEIYDRKLTDIFAVESEIAKTIADTLQAKLTGSEKAAISSAPTENPEAYQLYLQGRFFWSKRTAPDLRKSIDYFNQATEKDPRYALAYAAAAQSWVLLPGYDGGAPLDCFPQAESAARKALALDETLSDAHTALGAVKSCLGFDFAGAIDEFERALKLNPNDSTAHHWLGNHPLTNLGQLDRALVEIKRARELDPLSLIINSNIGYTLMLSGKDDEAIAQLRKTLELDGSFYYARFTLGNALEHKGSFAEAIAEYQRAIELSDDIAPLGFLGHLYAKMGRRDEAKKILDRLLETRKQRYTEVYFTGLVYLGLGDRAEALRYFEQSYQDRDAYDIGQIRVDPFLKELHGDPRFEALAEKIVPAKEFEKALTQK
jgi:TolB-like protein/Flp pilus assembly protein TadD